MIRSVKIAPYFEESNEKGEPGCYLPFSKIKILGVLHMAINTTIHAHDVSILDIPQYHSGVVDLFYCAPKGPTGLAEGLTESVHYSL